MPISPIPQRSNGSGPHIAKGFKPPGGRGRLSVESFKEVIVDERLCRICGLNDYHHVAGHDLNSLDLSRFKWGGVDHTSPIYAALDLQFFLEEPAAAPIGSDVDIFQELISAMETAPATTTSATLHKLFPAALKANKAERDQLIAILGICGILATPDYPGFAKHFVPCRAVPCRAVPCARAARPAFCGYGISSVLVEGLR